MYDTVVVSCSYSTVVLQLGYTARLGPPNGAIHRRIAGAEGRDGSSCTVVGESSSLGIRWMAY